MEMMLWIVAAIVCCVVLFGFVELLVWIWDKLDPPAEIKEVRCNEKKRAA